MTSLIKRGLEGVVVLLVLACSANASLVTDGNGMGGEWQNKRNFTSPTPRLCVDVEYCVYAPGQFGLSFPSWIDPNDPAYSTHYVYAYQIVNDVDSHPDPNFAVAVRYFSVGLSGGGEQAANIGHVDDASYKEPNQQFFDSLQKTARWDFTTTGTNIPYGYTSVVLFFSSPFGPGRDNSTVKYSASYFRTISETDPDPLPSPAPEPATVGLLGAGLLVLTQRARRKKG
jgi:hypothetical protein